MVDDSAPDRRLCRIFLEEVHGAGIQFFEAPDALQGLEVCRTVAPDCVLLDYKLPDMTGLEFLAKLQPEGSSTEPCFAVVMLTGMSSEEVAVEAMRSGAQDYLHKDLMSARGLAMAILKATQKVRLIRDLREGHRRLARSLAEKEVLIQEVHHRVKNNLQIIASLLRMQAQAMKEPVAASALRDSQHRIEVMSMIHEQLYGSPELQEVNLGQQANLLMQNLLHSFGVDPAHITGEVCVEDRADGPLVLGVDQAIPTLLILNELVSNALKHAIPPERRGIIRIEARSRDKKVELSVIDDGIGMPEDLAVKKSKSLGLQIVEILSRQLRGTWEFKRDGGTKFHLSFPER
jgi:two-component sensor histidine kinase